jgi:hypothetical protein
MIGSNSHNRVPFFRILQIACSLLYMLITLKCRFWSELRLIHCRKVFSVRAIKTRQLKKMTPIAYDIWDNNSWFLVSFSCWSLVKHWLASLQSGMVYFDRISPYPHVLTASVPIKIIFLLNLLILSSLFCEWDDASHATIKVETVAY